MSTSNREKWNRIYGNGGDNPPTAAQVLAEFDYLLPVTGHALDLACGRGGNALLLARHGLDTWAWDISDAAVEQLRERARNEGVRIDVQQRDVSAMPPEPGTFDVIVVSRYLERALAPRLILALRKQGLLFYQTFIKEKSADTGPRNPDYLLGPNELLDMFHSLHVICYREEGRLGDSNRGLRNEAMLIAQKR